MMTVALIANGLINSFDLIRPLILQNQRIVAVDGGLIYCQKMNLIPDLIVGDFDSCPKDLLKNYPKIPQKILPQDKDVTDLEYAMNEELRRGAAKITLFGAWGGRIDHSLVNTLLLTRNPGKIIMETEQEQLFCIENHAKIHCFTGQTISLIPMNGPVYGITTHCLKWELKDSILDHSFIGISNLCMSNCVEIFVEKGSLICSLLKTKP